MYISHGSGSRERTNALRVKRRLGFGINQTKLTITQSQHSTIPTPALSAGNFMVARNNACMQTVTTTAKTRTCACQSVTIRMKMNQRSGTSSFPIPP